MLQNFDHLPIPKTEQEFLEHIAAGSLIPITPHNFIIKEGHLQTLNMEQMDFFDFPPFIESLLGEYSMNSIF